MSTQTNVVTLQAQAPKADYIVFDLETSDAPESAIEAAIAGWKAPSNWKPETVEAKRAEKAESIRDKAALLDSSPIACIAALASTGARVVFAGMGEKQPCEVPGWVISQMPTEREMLQLFGAWLDMIAGPDTRLVNHNLFGFDLPKLRGAFVRNRLPLPLCLKPRDDGSRQPAFDTMRQFQGYSIEHRDTPFVSLDTACIAFGIDRPKQHMSGAEVPRLVREGRFSEVIVYSAIDVSATDELYRLMTA